MCVTVWMCVHVSVCMHVCAAREFNLSSMGRGVVARAALQQKGVY